MQSQHSSHMLPLSRPGTLLEQGTRTWDGTVGLLWDSTGTPPGTGPCLQSGKVQQGWVLGKRDLCNGFFHLVLSPTARKAMGLRHPTSGRLARWVVLPQGTK